MKSLLLALILIFSVLSLRAAAPVYGILVVQDARVAIREGASAESKVAGYAYEGQELELRADQLIQGFYKVSFQGHVCFVAYDSVALIKESLAPAPTPTPAPGSMVMMTKVGSPVTSSGKTLDQLERVPTPSPGIQKSPATGMVAASAPTPSRSGAEGNRAPVATPTPRRAVGRAMQATPTPIPRTTSRVSKAATPVPRNPVRQVQHSGTQKSAGNSQSVLSREPSQPSRVMFFLPLGMGKPYDVKPAFKPDATYHDSRNINASGFGGLGVEWRFFRFLRAYCDLTGHEHHTHAALTSTAAVAVDVPGETTLLFDKEVDYSMQSAGIRVGLRLGLPLGRYEPWVGGGYGYYSWAAEYRDPAKTTTHGKDEGTAFSFTGQVGVDINFAVGALLLRMTPFGELGSPVVHPTITDIAGTGKTWHDTQGTAIMVPRRLGLMLSLGY